MLDIFFILLEIGFAVCNLNQTFNSVVLIISTGYGTAVTFSTRGLDPLAIEVSGKIPSDFNRNRIGLKFAEFS